MRSKYVLNKNNKNTNPKIKNLKITIFSNPAKSSNPKASKYQINPKIQHNQSNKKKNLKLKKTHPKQVEPSKPTWSKPRFGGHAPCRRALLWRKARSTTPFISQTSNHLGLFLFCNMGHSVVLNSWVSWVNFCWVVVPIWVRVAVVSGSDLGLVCGLLRGLVFHLWFGLWFIGGFGHCDCSWVSGLL